MTTCRRARGAAHAPRRSCARVVGGGAARSARRAGARDDAVRRRSQILIALHRRRGRRARRALELRSTATSSPFVKMIDRPARRSTAHPCAWILADLPFQRRRAIVSSFSTSSDAAELGAPPQRREVPSTSTIARARPGAHHLARQAVVEQRHALLTLSGTPPIMPLTDPGLHQCAGPHSAIACRSRRIARSRPVHGLLRDQPMARELVGRELECRRPPRSPAGLRMPFLVNMPFYE